MSKRFILDILIFISFLIVVLSGFALWLILPRGSQSIFIFPRGQWFPIHIWTSMSFIFFIGIHLIVNRCVIKEYFEECCKKNPNKR